MAKPLFYGTARNLRGPIKAGALVEIRDNTTGALVDLYTAADDTVSEDNPVQADAYGYFAVRLDQPRTISITITHEGESRTVAPIDVARSQGDRLNVKDFGAIGDGVADDTTAIDAAWAALLSTSEDYSTPISGFTFSERTKVLYFPPGTYRYAGTGLTQPGGSGKNWGFQGDWPGAVRIDNESNIFLITLSDPRGIDISNISFTGGKGVLRCTNSSGNVGAIRRVRNCQFWNYTTCALGNNATDDPHLYVDHCYFDPGTANDTTAIGIAWGGLLDQVQVTNCIFAHHRYHLKLGPKVGGSFFVGPNNFFYGATQADIWMAPRSTADNIGRGAFIIGNKFGNEELTLSAPRILVANEGTTVTDRLDTYHSTTATTTDYIGHFTIRDNVFAFSSGYSVGLVQSYAQRTCFNMLDNQIDGTKPPYLIELAGGLTEWYGHYECNQWSIGRLQILNDGEPAGGIRLSNYPYMGPIAAPWDESIADVAAVVAYADDLGEVDNQTCGSRISGAVAVTGPYGDSDAGEITFTVGGTPPNIRLNAPEKGRMFWLDVLLKKSATNPVDSVQVYINRNDSTGRREMGRTVQLTDQWQRIVLPVMLREWDGSEAVRLIVDPIDDDISTGSTDRAQIGWMRLYYARSALAVTRPGFELLGDADASTDADTPELLILDTPLTANRTLTLDNATGVPGQRMRVERRAASTGNFKLTVGTVDLWGGRPGGSSADWAEFIHRSGSWELVARSAHLGIGVNGPTIFGGPTIDRHGGGDPFFLFARAGTNEAQMRSTAAGTIEFRNATGTVTALKVGSGYGVELPDAKDVVLNTTTGSKIGTGTTQKLGFWNATPIVQPSGAAQAALTNSSGGSADGTIAAVSGTGDDATINDNLTELHTLLDAMRTALVNAGLMKGSA